jgi:uncharacterized protein YecT (DUF1311 family)
MEKTKLLLLTLCMGVLSHIISAPAHADSNPDWWIPYAENAPEADYSKFTLTSEQAKMLYESDVHEKCMKHAQGRDRLQNICIAKEGARIEEQEAYLEKRLNRSYGELLKDLGLHQKEVLESAQEQWRLSRWDICMNDPEVVKYHRADWHRVSVGSCTLKELARRVAWIEQYHGYANRYNPE